MNKKIILEYRPDQFNEKDFIVIEVHNTLVQKPGDALTKKELDRYIDAGPAIYDVIIKQRKK
jgi:hypothetical protein